MSATSVSPSVSFPGEWHRWIIENKMQGLEDDEIVAILVSNGLNENQARQEVDKINEAEPVYEAGLRLAGMLNSIFAHEPMPKVEQDFQKKIEELKPGKNSAGKLPGRFNVQLVHCKRCYAGQIISKLLVGQGKQLKQTEVARANLHQEFVRSVVS